MRDIKREIPKIAVDRPSALAATVRAGRDGLERVEVRVKVDNANDIELPVTGLEYTIWLMGDDFAEGTSDHSFVLPALGEAEFDMTVTQEHAAESKRRRGFGQHGGLVLWRGLIE